jgi:hypothetical protein
MTTTRVAIAALVGAGMAAGLGIAGGVAIYNTTDGQVLGGDVPEVAFPVTPTGVIAVVDGGANLTSLAAFAIRPASEDAITGRGGTVVPVPISADASGGFGTERLPLNETVNLFGISSIADEAAVLLGVTIDQVTVVETSDLADVLAPLGTVDVDLPAAVTDSSGTQLAAAGAGTLGVEQVAAILGAHDPDTTGADRYPIDVAVWSGIAETVAEGLDSPLARPESAQAAAGAGAVGEAEDLLAQLTSGPITVQPLRNAPIVSLDVNPRGVDAVALDRAEVAVVFGHIAPSKVSAPYPGYNFRIVSHFDDSELPDGVSALDVAYTATKALIGMESNVLSVDTAPGEADSVTVIEVNDDILVVAAATLGEVFGSVEVRVAETRVAGIDVIVTLGTDYLGRLDMSSATATTAPAGSAPDSSTVAPDNADGTN